MFYNKSNFPNAKQYTCYTGMPSNDLYRTYPDNTLYFTRMKVKKKKNQKLSTVYHSSHNLFIYLVL